MSGTAAGVNTGDAKIRIMIKIRRGRGDAGPWIDVLMRQARGGNLLSVE
jgi:hypothetical protein